MSIEETSYQADIQFSGYIFEELSFLYNGLVDGRESADNVGPIQTIFQVGIGRETEDESNPKRYVKISCYVNKDHTSNPPFSISAVMRGEFVINPSVSDEEAKKLLEVNGVAVMFPFLRASIANLTTASGVSAMVLPLINISKLMSIKDASS